MSFSTFGQKTKSVDAPIQVWAEVDGVKTGGGTIDISSLPDGAVIAAGTPVALGKSGGVLTPIYFYELAIALTALDTKATFIGDAPLEAEGNLIEVPSVLGGSGTGVAYTNAVKNGNGTFTVDIVANSLGTAEAGTVYAVADVAGEGAVVANKAIPAGLLWHDIVKEEGDTLATGDVVDSGRIYEDRIVAIPQAYKAVLTDVKFEKGV